MMGAFVNLKLLPQGSGKLQGTNVGLPRNPSKKVSRGSNTTFERRGKPPYGEIQF